MAHTFNNTPKPESDFEVLPDGAKVVVKCVKAELGYTKRTEKSAGGDRKVTLELKVEGHRCHIMHTLTVKKEGQPGFDLCRWQIDNALLAFGIVTPEDKGFVADLDSQDWVDANFVDNRCWATVKQEDFYKDREKPAADRRKANKIDEFIVGEALPEEPPQPAKELPQF